MANSIQGCAPLKGELDPGGYGWRIDTGTLTNSAVLEGGVDGEFDPGVHPSRANGIQGGMDGEWIQAHTETGCERERERAGQ